MVAKKKNKSSSKNPASVKARLAALSKGLRALAPTVQLDVSGTLTPAPQAADDVDKDLGLYTATDVAHQSYEVTKEARDNAEPTTLAHLEQWEAALVAKFGKSAQALSDFGITPKASQPHRTTASKAAAAAKADATKAEEEKAKPTPPSVPPKA